jgi:hypothetical protein
MQFTEDEYEILYHYVSIASDSGHRQQRSGIEIRPLWKLKNKLKAVLGRMDANDREQFEKAWGEPAPAKIEFPKEM